MVDFKITKNSPTRLTNVGDMLRLLKENYPSLPLRHGECYNPTYKGAIWTGLDNGVMSNGKPIFITGEHLEYESGVNKKFQLWLKSLGWYAEGHDGETFFIFKANEVN